jgi:NNP family nitrate/nitrite transporter-like MFS transporter
VLRTPHFWILTVLFTLAVAVNFGTYNMLPLYLVSRHSLDSQWANNLVSMSRIPCLVMALSAGIMLDRIGVRPGIVLSLGFTGAVTVLLGLLQGPVLQAAVLAQALFAACYFPAGFSAISWSFPDRVRNVAISVIIPPATLLGIGVAPAVLGWFGDAGHFPLGFSLLGSVVVLGCGLVRFLSLKPALEDGPG